MILGLGTDIVAIERIADLVARYGDRFVDRCFSPAEKDLAAGRGAGRNATLAARWAAKEAFLKALGGDVRTIPYRDVEVVRDPRGPVALALYGRAEAALAERGGARVHLSLSHERTHALAVVVIEG